MIVTTQDASKSLPWASALLESGYQCISRAGISHSEANGA